VIKLATIAVCAVALMTGPAANAKTLKVKDPLSATKELYAQLEKDFDKANDDLPMSARLTALSELDSKEAHGEVGRFDGDIYVNGQDAKISHVEITSRDVENAKNRLIVIARFKNFEDQQEIHYFWEKTSAGWAVDDVRALDKDGGWTLSLMYKYGWDGPEALAKKDKAGK
jgi:hypothetical protein